MYSVLPVVNNANTHVGFYAYLAFVACVIFLYFKSKNSKEVGFSDVGFTVLVCLSLIYAHHNSFAPEYNVVMKNEKVIVEFIGYEPQREMYSCGKNGRDSCYKNTIYGKFKTPEGLVLLPVDSKSPIADEVILYKN